MTKKTYFIKAVPTSVPVKHEIVVSKPNYSIPKIYIPKDKNGKPTVAPGKQWYVYYYFRNPQTGKMQKFIYKEGINRYKTVKERKELARQLADAYHDLLKIGFDPFTKEGVPIHDFEANKTYTLIEALNYVLKDKINTWKTSTATNMVFRINTFIAWCKKVHIANLDVTKITKKHIIAYLKSQDHLSATSINNNRRALSAIFGVLSGEGIINTNIAAGIPKLKSKPKKNIPFTVTQISNIKAYLLKHDPVMYHFVKFVFYGFLRPIEVVRLEPKYFDLDNNIYRVETKRDTFKTKILVPQLKESFLQLTTNQNLKTDWLFTNEDAAALSLTEKQRYDHFNRRFRKVKKHFKFGNLYGIYSLRHSAALDQYTYFEKQGLFEHEIIQKLLPITGHKTEQSLRAYLREIGSNLPKGYETNFSIDL